MKRTAMIVMLFCLMFGATATTRVAGSGVIITSVSQRDSSSSSADLGRLIDALKSQNAVERATAACALGEMRESAAPAISHLIRLLGDETPVRITECGGRGKGRFFDDDDSPGKEAAIALSRIGPLAVDPLILALKTQEVPARKNAAFSLGLLKDDRTVDPLIAAISDSAWQVRSQAAWGLGLKHDSRAVEPLITALKDAEWQVREQAAWASGLVGNRDSVEPLTTALRDDHSRVRAQAAWALG